MKRKYRPTAHKRWILAKQKGYCFYCGQTIGEMCWYKKPVILKAHMEHVVPFGLSGIDTDDNIVISCQVCNSIKVGKIFDSFADLLLHIQNKWAEHGEMMLNRIKEPEAVKRQKAMGIKYGVHIGVYSELSIRQIKFIKQMVRDVKCHLKEVKNGMPEM
jgi:HNH endonuclease